MQLNINTKGTYVHIKDEMFEVKVSRDEGVIVIEPPELKEKVIRACEGNHTIGVSSS